MINPVVQVVFHKEDPLLCHKIEMWPMLQNSAMHIVSAPRQVVGDADLRRRKFFGARSAEIFQYTCLFLIGFLN